MARVNLLLLIVFVVVLLAVGEGKKNVKKTAAKEIKAPVAPLKAATPSKDTQKAAKSDDDQDAAKPQLQQTSLPAASVMPASLPAATRESDDTSFPSGDKSDQSSGEDSGSGEADRGKESSTKQVKVKSTFAIEKDRNKIAETVKKSVQVNAKGEEIKSSTSKKSKKQDEEASNKVADKKEAPTEEDDSEEKSDETEGTKTDTKKSKTENKKDDKKKKENDSKTNSGKKDKSVSKSNVEDSKKSEKSSKHGHHHHHHHKHHHDKKNKRPSNPANEPKKDYPTFDWQKFGKDVNMTAKIPGWPGQPSIAQLLALSQLASGSMQRNVVSWPIGKVLNGSINSQADIATVDRASVETTDNSAQRDKTSSTPAPAPSPLPAPASAPAEVATNSSSSSDSVKSSSVDKNPVAEAVASDTGEAPPISKTADVKVPNNIPARCAILVKTYSNGELTLKDYLIQMKKCKKADTDFNQAHPGASNGNAMLRTSIATNGAFLTKEAYKYALERMRNYVPSVKEKQAAEQILAKWRSNSFGARVAGDGIVPDAIKSFMTGQTVEEEGHLDKKGAVQAQKDKAMDTAKQLILGTVTGRQTPVTSIKKSDINQDPSQTVLDANIAANKKAFIANPKQSVATVLAAAQSLIGDKSKGQAVVLAPGGASTSLLASMAKKSAIATPNQVLQNKAKALEMAKTAEKLNAALLSQVSSNVIAPSRKTGTDLLAALKDMSPGPGPEAPIMAPLNVMSSVQKRSIRDNVNKKSKRKRRSLSLLGKSRKSHKRSVRKRRELIGRPSLNDNAIERSKLNKPIIPGPKLIDRIRDMSMIMATP